MVKHFIPTTLNEALSILHEHKCDIIAGGTDIMVQRRTWADLPREFDGTINIINIPELQRISEDENNVYIGATASLTDVCNHKSTPELLKKSIFEIASPALRNIGTIAGNIANASPAGDTIPILYLLDAMIEIKSLSTSKQVPIKDVIIGHRKTSLHHDELITTIIIPKKEFTSTSFVKVGGRKADAISKLSFTGAYIKQNDKITDIRMVFGAVAPVMVRDEIFEASLHQKTPKEINDELNDIIAHYTTLIKPIDDQRSNKQYRKQVSLNLLKDFIHSL